MYLEPVIHVLPADFTRLVEEARAEGYRFLDRLANDWASGAIRFNRPGEMLLVAYSDERMLAGIGGITVDPSHDSYGPWRDAKRMSRVSRSNNRHA